MYSFPVAAKFPFLVTITFSILIFYFGIGFLFGFLIIAIIFILMIYLANLSQKYNESILKAKDIPMTKTSEALENILLIKFNSWIDWFINQINNAWKYEESQLKGWYTLSLINSIVYYSMYPLLILTIYSVSLIWFDMDITLANAVAGLQIIF